MDKNTSYPTPKTPPQFIWSINARRERGWPFLSFPPSQQKFKPKPAKNTSWTCERELRSWIKAEQLLRGKERGQERVGGNWQKKENRERKKKGGNGRKRKGKYYQTVQTYLDLKGKGHVVFFCPLVLQTQNWKWWRIPKKNWPKPPRLIVKETENN
jgi:hypothetical protein